MAALRPETWFKSFRTGSWALWLTSASITSTKTPTIGPLSHPRRKFHHPPLCQQDRTSTLIRIMIMTIVMPVERNTTGRMTMTVNMMTAWRMPCQLRVLVVTPGRRHSRGCRREII
ncbi:hypothetical protein B0T25DRAFT_533192 [Lasiosphaeria hispida]|uniref:Uncharacterized protein n=1 Tax=Lasiosphaeria hispida TaxID=260671 RepID=A0AAJ0HQW6_9PEZI|nr:hypothetical protein B0T25DRAFT_533192 [Lasiosphaeria hispida]